MTITPLLTPPPFSTAMAELFGLAFGSQLARLGNVAILAGRLDPTALR
jgi:hypothetical protein